LRRLRYLPTGALVPSAEVSRVALVVPAVAIIVGLLTAGCGPIEYINQVSVRAASAVSAAKLAQADRYAPYEYTAAEEYLHKAREEAGHSEYEDAIDFGQKAEELANKGRAIAVARLSQSASASSAATPTTEGRADVPAPAPDAPRPEGE